MKGLESFPGFFVALVVLITGQLLVLTSVFIIGVDDKLLTIAWGICIAGLVVMAVANVLLAVSWRRYEQQIKIIN